MEWKPVLGYIPGTEDQEPFWGNECLVARYRLLLNQITGWVGLKDGKRMTLAELGKRFKKQALADVASVVQPVILLA